MNLNIFTHINRWKFIKDVQRIHSRDFSIISSNCIGGRIYESLGCQYLTPTVGLFFYPVCFLKFVESLDHYMTVQPKIITHSRYIDDPSYPVARLDDVEIHFLHYESGTGAINRWLARRDRINKNNLFITMTDRDGFLPEFSLRFDKLHQSNKVLFSARKYPTKSSCFVPSYQGDHCVGDLYSNFHNFVGAFSFYDWIEGQRTSVPSNIQFIP